ncbi:hypothetical protein H113_07462 [Trichophyton rubrum MR1459]|uniref:Uncharacterized protein n=1 Tax=Trichophyton rubrum (strain ATCC MYA-4607 / CBS 118892) TaxID=559305 RepID=A0A087PFD5_TRIRC|nr:uncharacterized protein TERG_11503 [Trichophyton rubrum CBS 118892]EZF91596.1 hypothetical protein H113_07462 [Trichophyton rubrum MR1459]EZG02632.1 hypothetical protein H106_07240 [Trichophyton rubrum CBS 735.88]KFL60088.1 hypothetical protein TERG_11503 [Trichophyton rubrum CBS 118892]
MCSLRLGKNWATINVAIQLDARAQLCVAPTASGPTSSEARMNGTGPRPTAKLVTNKSVATAERTLKLDAIPIASNIDMLPIPDILSKIHVFRPSLSDNGAQMTVMIRFRQDTRTVRRAAVVGRIVDRSETLYMTILLMPVNCCVSIIAMTDIMAGLYIGSINAPNIVTASLEREAVLDDGFARRDSSSSVSTAMGPLGPEGVEVCQVLISSLISAVGPLILCRIFLAWTMFWLSASQTGLSTTNASPKS